MQVFRIRQPYFKTFRGYVQGGYPSQIYFSLLYSCSVGSTTYFQGGPRKFLNYHTPLLHISSDELEILETTWKGKVGTRDTSRLNDEKVGSARGDGSSGTKDLVENIISSEITINGLTSSLLIYLTFNMSFNGSVVTCSRKSAVFPLYEDTCSFGQFILSKAPANLSIWEELHVIGHFAVIMSAIALAVFILHWFCIYGDRCKAACSRGSHQVSAQESEQNVKTVADNDDVNEEMMDSVQQEGDIGQYVPLEKLKNSSMTPLMNKDGDEQKQ